VAGPEPSSSAWLAPFCLSVRPAIVGVREKDLSTAFTMVRTILLYDLHPGRVDTSVCNLKEGGGLLYAVKLQNATAALNLDAPQSD